jgi:hypothetical protein
MATLNQLIEAVAGVTGLPKANVFAYGRFARQAGLIGQAGRGRSAASMTVTDAANLLIAIGGTAVTREAGVTVETFRKLKNGRCDFFAAPPFAAGIIAAGIEFLANYGVRPSGQGGNLSVKIPGDFGNFFEFLINSTLDKSLTTLFHKIPSAEIPDDLWREWTAEKGDPHRLKSMEDLIEEGLITPAPVASLEFGVHFNVEFRFNRLVPSVEIEFQRDWDGAQVVSVIAFGPERGGKALGQHRLRVAAEFTQHTLAAAALVVRNMVRPSAVHTLKAVNQLFADQFRTVAGCAEAANRAKVV